MRNTKLFSISLLLTLAMLFSACGGASFASQLRLILAASVPLVDSLNLGAGRQAVIADFTDLANGAATLGDSLKTCAADKPCKLNAVESYERLFETVEARGHFGQHPKLQNIESILRSVIAAARIYYGGQSPSLTGRGMSEKEAGAAIKAKIDELKAAMNE